MLTVPARLPHHDGAIGPMELLSSNEWPQPLRSPTRPTVREIDVTGTHRRTLRRALGLWVPCRSVVDHHTGAHLGRGQLPHLEQSLPYLVGRGLLRVQVLSPRSHEAAAAMKLVTAAKSKARWRPSAKEGEISFGKKLRPVR